MICSCRHLFNDDDDIDVLKAILELVIPESCDL